MYWPYFSLSCGGFEINENRTASYLSNACEICVPNSLLRDLGTKYYCNCNVLNWEIFTDEEGDDTVIPANYVAPDIDGAPWYNPDSPESAGFLGFLVNDIKMNSVVGRSVTTRATAYGGGVLGPLRRTERTIEFNVFMFACNSESMDYGFRYLTDALGGVGCDDGDCTLCEAEYRDNCAVVGDPPTVSQFESSLWILKNVGLLSGPNYTDNPAPSLACNVREVTFTLVSEQPYKYKCPITEVDNEAFTGMPVDCQSIDSWFCDDSTICNSVEENITIGETALIIQVQAGSKPLGDVRIEITPDQFGYVCSPETAPAGYVPPSPCASIRLTDVPSGAKLVYDTSIESIYMILPGGDVVDATRFLDPRVADIPSYPTLRCGSFCLCISVERCSVSPGSTLTVYSQHREL